MFTAPKKLAGLEGEAERSLLAVLQQAQVAFEELSKRPVVTTLQRSAYTARVGELVRCAPPANGMSVLLPAAVPENATGRISLLIETPGIVRASAVASLVNNARAVTFEAVGLVELVSNGAGAWVSEHSVGSGEASAAPTDATYLLQAADERLPNAFVGLTSTEIEWVFLSGFVSLSLRNNSVALTRLRNIADETFIGNVSGAPASPAAIGLSTLAGAGISWDGAANEFDWDGLGVRRNGILTGTRRFLNFIDPASPATFCDVVIATTDDAANDEDEITAGLQRSANLTIASNISGGTQFPSWNGLSAIIDACLGSTRGAILERGASGWQIVAPGTTDFPLVSNGGGADPAYERLVNAGLADMAQGTSKGRITKSGTGAPVDLTGAQQAQNVRPSTVLSVTLSGTVNNLDNVAVPGWSNGTVTVLAITLSADCTLTGMDASVFQDVHGKELELQIIAGNFTLTLPHDNAGSTLGNRFSNDRFIQCAFRVGQRIRVRYDQFGYFEVVAASGPGVNQVFNNNLAQMIAGAVKGRQIDAGTGDPVDLTGAEVAELLRWNTVQVVAPSTTGTVTLNADTTVLTFSGTGTIQGITGGTPGRVLWLFHTAGGGSLTTLSFDDAAAAATDQMRYTLDTAYTWGNSATAHLGGLLIYAGQRWYFTPAGRLFTSTRAGGVPASGGGTTNFLRADATWAAPPACLRVDMAYAADASITITPPAGATWFKARFKSGGGGGGGADADTDGETCAGGGGGEAGETELWVAIVSGNITGSIGAGGTAGTNTGGNGGAGGTTSLVYNGQTSTPPSGFGGIGTAVGAGAAATNAKATSGGLGGTSFTTAASFIFRRELSGAAGQNGFMWGNAATEANAAASGGNGGGGGGGGQGGIAVNAAATGNGQNGRNGCGGGGGARIATGAATGAIGGTGGDGWMVVEFYSGPVPTLSNIT